MTLYDYLYDTAALERWADRLRPFRARRDVWIFFNNDWHGHALTNAAELREPPVRIA